MRMPPGILDMVSVLISVVVSQVFTCVQGYKVAYLRFVNPTIYMLYFD